MSSHALYHCVMVTSGFPSDNFRYSTLLQWDWWWYCSDWTCERIFFFLYTRIWNGVHWICNLALYHWTSVTSGFHFWTISGIQLWYRGIGGGIVLIAHMRHALFVHARISTGHFWFSSSALLEIAMVPSGFCLWQFQVFNSGAEGWVVVLFWLDLWEISFCLQSGFKWDFWISSPALYHCAKVTSGFHLQ